MVPDTFISESFLPIYRPLQAIFARYGLGLDATVVNAISGHFFCGGGNDDGIAILPPFTGRLVAPNSRTTTVGVAAEVFSEISFRVIG